MIGQGEPPLPLNLNGASHDFVHFLRTLRGIWQR